MIPRLIHFIFGLAPDFGGKPFSFIHYMAVKSAHVCNPGYRIRFYCRYEPSGIFWEVARRYVELVHVEPPIEIHGRTLHHVAHQADVLRLQYLIEQGGIYLDLDTITVRSYDDLLHHSVVMGVQGRGQKIDGLCNAVMMAQPQAPFMVRWLASYRSFRSKGRDAHWDEHSVRVPLQLARQHPQELTILDRGAFFHPSAEKQGLLDLFVEDLRFPDAYCHHLWEGLAWRLISQIDERNVNLIDTTYNRLARRFIGEDAAIFAEQRERMLAMLLQPPVRVNLGCGARKHAGWLNVDTQPAASPDLRFDITQPGWPLADDSVEEAELSHVLEHTGGDFETVTRELYRVCRHGARVHIRLPHPRHDWFLTDPTHNRALLPASFELLDAEKCKRGLLAGDTASALALYWGVDFEVVAIHSRPGPQLKNAPRSWLLLTTGYPFVRAWAKRLLNRVGRPTGAQRAPEDAELHHLATVLNNTIGEFSVELVVRKSGKQPVAGRDRPGAQPIDAASLLTQVN